MVTITRAKASASRFAAQFQPKERKITAVVGHPDGTTVAVPGRSNHVYVMLPTDPPQLVAAFAPTRVGVTHWGQRAWVVMRQVRGRSSYELMLPDALPTAPGVESPYAYCQIEWSVPGILEVAEEGKASAPQYTCSIPGGLEIRGFNITVEDVTPETEWDPETECAPHCIIVDVEVSIDFGETWVSIFTAEELLPFLFSEQKYFEPFYGQGYRAMHMDYVYDTEVGTPTEMPGSISDSGQDFMEWGLQVDPPRCESLPARFMVIVHNLDGSYGWGPLGLCNEPQTCDVAWSGTGGAGIVPDAYKVVMSDQYFVTKWLSLGDMLRMRITAVGVDVAGEQLVFTLFVRQSATGVPAARDISE